MRIHSPEERAALLNLVERGRTSPLKKAAMMGFSLVEETAFANGLSIEIASKIRATTPEVVTGPTGSRPMYAP
jgi:hypothetical protein